MLKDRTRPTGAALVSLRDVRVRAAGCDLPLLQVPALDLLPGERIVVTGPSGSGKSLLLATLMGRLPVGVEFSGERRAELSRIGVIPQRGLDAFHPLIPLRRQITAVTRFSGTHLREVMATVGLGDPDLLNRRAGELSGGQAQRAAVALAALTDAPLVVADEPTSALDHASRDRTLALLQTVLSPAQTLVVVTHDPAVADVLGGRRLRVSAGQVSEDARQLAHTGAAR